MANKLFRVEHHHTMMVYAEDVEDAQFLFTQHMDEDTFTGDQEVIAMECNNYPKSWENSIPWGEEDDRTCKQIKEQEGGE